LPRDEVHVYNRRAIELMGVFVGLVV
jgi:hypothetical protein